MPSKDNNKIICGFILIKIYNKEATNRMYFWKINI